MLQIINPRSLPLSHVGCSDADDIGIVAKCWGNTRPIIKELEQTVNFAERKCGDLMQQLNLCKEYYEKWSTERFTGGNTMKRKPRRKLCKKTSGDHSSSENESEKVTTEQMSNNFNEKIKHKIFEKTNEIKDANRKILLREACFRSSQTRSNDVVPPSHVNNDKENTDNNTSQSGIISVKNSLTIPVYETTKSEYKEEKESEESLNKTPKRGSSKKRVPILVTRHSTLQRYKIRSKSLPQGVRRKFGFGSFVEVVEKEHSKHGSLTQIKSKTTVSSGSKTVIGRERRPKSRPMSKSISRSSDTPNSRAKDVNGSITKRIGDGSKLLEDTATNTMNTQVAQVRNSVNRKIVVAQNTRSCSTFNQDLDSNQCRQSATFIQEDPKYVKSENFFSGRPRSLILMPRQPIPFTICRTAKTFNLGLNIQQVLSLIKSKRHSALLQAVLKDNMRTTKSVIQKTEPNIKALYIATSSRLGRTSETEICPARDDGDHCYSVISASTGNNSKCNMLTCNNLSVFKIENENSMKGDEESHFAGEQSFVDRMKCNQVQRPEDVWVVEQPDPHQNFQGYRSRCTCFPTRNSVDYQKVLKQYSRMSQSQQKADGYHTNGFCTSAFPTGFVMTRSDLCTLPLNHEIAYNNKINGPKVELKKIQEDLDNLTRRYERAQEQLEYHTDDCELDRELNALEMELNYREEDCNIIINFYNQLMTLKKNIRDLRRRFRSSTNITDNNSKVQKSRKDPFRPTPSMALTRVLRQIQWLQHKIKLIDYPPSLVT